MGRSLKEWILWSMDPEAWNNEGSLLFGSGGNECCSDIWRSDNVGEWGPDGKQKAPASCMLEGASCPLYGPTNLVSDMLKFIRSRGPWATKARKASLPGPAVAGDLEADGTALGEGDDVVASGGEEEKAAADDTYAESSPFARRIIAAARQHAVAAAPVTGIAPVAETGDGAPPLSVTVAEAAADEGFAVIRPVVGWRSPAEPEKQTVAATPVTGVAPVTKTADSPSPVSAVTTKVAANEGFVVIRPVVGWRSAVALEKQTVAATPVAGVAPVTKTADSPSPVSVATTKAADTCPAVYNRRVLAIGAPTRRREEAVVSSVVVWKHQAAETCPAVHAPRVLAIGAPNGPREETVVSSVAANKRALLHPPGGVVVWKHQEVEQTFPLVTTTGLGETAVEAPMKTETVEFPMLPEDPGVLVTSSRTEGPGQLYVPRPGIDEPKALLRSDTVRGEKSILALAFFAGVLLILACRRLTRRWRAEKEEGEEKEGEGGEEEEEEVWQDAEDEVREDAKEEEGAGEEEEAPQGGRARIAAAPSGQGESIEPAPGSSRVQSSREEKKKTRLRCAPIVHEIRFSAPDKDVLLGGGGFLEFFRDTFPVSFIVDDKASVVRLFGHGSGHIPECARACLEHAIWVSREGGYQPSDFVLMRHTLAKTVYGANVGVDDMALAAEDFVQNLSSVVEKFGCVGHYVDEHMLSLAGPSRQPPAARPPPDRRFAPPLFVQHENIRVVQLWGLHHCVLAARRHLGLVLTRQTKGVKRVLRIGRDAVSHAEHSLQGNGINIPGVTYDSAKGQLRVEGPEATDVTFDELLRWLNAHLPCFGVVPVDSPILMRMLASHNAIAQSVATAGVAGIVNVVGTWNPCRLLIWSRNTGSTGVDAMEKLRSVFFRKMARWKSREVSVAVPALVCLFPHARRTSNIASEGDVGTTWPLELAKLSNVVGTTLWLDGMHMRGQLASDAPRKYRALAALIKAVEALALAHGKHEPVPPGFRLIGVGCSVRLVSTAFRAGCHC